MIEKETKLSHIVKEVCIFGIVFMIGLLGASTAFFFSANLDPPTDFPTVIEPGSMAASADYVVFISNNVTYARNGTTGGIDYSGSARVTIQNAVNNGGLIYISEGTYKVYGGLISLPKGKETILQGAGAPSIEPDILVNSSGTIIESYSDVLLNVSGSAPTYWSVVNIRDIEFRQITNPATPHQSFVNMDGICGGGIERCNIFAVAPWPKYGIGFSLYNGDYGNSVWVRDLNIGGFGGSDSPGVEFFPQMQVGNNHVLIENLHLNGMCKDVGTPALLIWSLGMRSLITELHLFQFGSAGSLWPLIPVYVQVPAAGGIKRVILIEDLNLESCIPMTGQTTKYFFALPAHNDTTIIIQRAFIGGCTGLDWNPLRANHPESLIVMHETGHGNGDFSLPMGWVTSFVDQTNHILSPAPVGASKNGTLLEGTLYVVEVRPLVLYIWSGAPTKIQITSNSISVELTYCSDLSQYYLYPGDYLYMEWNDGGQPTFKAYFEG